MEIKINKMKYLSPKAEVFVVKTEGSFCQSTTEAKVDPVSNPFSDITEEEW